MFNFIALFSSGQKINNIEVQKSGNKIIVDYQISGARFFETFNVSLYVSRDNGNTWEGPLKMVTGDIGKINTPGMKSITWDVLNEFPILNEEFIFDVRAEVLKDGVKKKFFSQYVGNFITPVGARVGVLGKTGVYFEARTSLKKGGSDFTYTNNLINNYNQAGYYSFNGDTFYEALSVEIGTTIQISRLAFFYAGAGYSTQKYWADFDVYDYNTDSHSGSDSALSTADEYSGVGISGGIIIKAGKLIVSAGGTTVNFETFNFTIGLGYAF